MSIFPFISPSVLEENTTEELPMYREYAYDFDNNKLLRDAAGNTYLVEGNEAIKIWIFKALHTQRYKYLAYSRDFGNECGSLTGQPKNKITFSELRRFIIESLMANPYITELKDFDFSRTPESVIVTFTCVTIYGEADIRNEF